MPPLPPPDARRHGVLAPRRPLMQGH